VLIARHIRKKKGTRTVEEKKEEEEGEENTKLTKEHRRPSVYEDEGSTNGRQADQPGGFTGRHR
jgi:hypothetical protein